MTAVLLLGVLPLLVVAATPIVVAAAMSRRARHRRRPVRVAAGRVALVAALVWSVSLRPDWSVA